MATIAYAGIPAHGHTNPTLAVMQELVKNGHRVLYYNAESFHAKVAPTGVEFRAIPEPLPSEREIAEALHKFINISLMLSSFSHHITRFLVEEFEREKPDLVLYDSIAMWGYVAARVNNIPQICLITTFVLDGSIGAAGPVNIAGLVWSALPHIPHLMRWKQSMSHEFGAVNSAGITDYSDVNIVFTSREFHPKNTFVDNRFHFVGPSIDASTRDGNFPFEQLSDGTIVYISLGTVNHLNTQFYKAVFEAFSDYPAQFILSVGKHTDLDTLGEIPENFIVQNYVPQLDILQHVDAFITHGGMNSVHEGLYYGVPLVVVPQHLEQALNGKRVAQTKTGILIGGHPPHGKVSAQRLRTVLEQMLTTPHYRYNAVQMGQTLKAAGGYLRAVEIIEQTLRLSQTEGVVEGTNH